MQIKTITKLLVLPHIIFLIGLFIGIFIAIWIDFILGLKISASSLALNVSYQIIIQMIAVDEKINKLK